MASSEGSSTPTSQLNGLSIYFVLFICFYKNIYDLAGRGWLGRLALIGCQFFNLIFSVSVGQSQQAALGQFDVTLAHTRVLCSVPWFPFFFSSVCLLSLFPFPDCALTPPAAPLLSSLVSPDRLLRLHYYYSHPPNISHL